MEREGWEELGARPAPSWYLDPAVARQKRDVHLELIRRRTAGAPVARALKTDLFEDAFGPDCLLDALFLDAPVVCGMDEAWNTARAAARRLAGRRLCVVVTDVRRLGFSTGAFDVVVSPSTLDHFERREDYLLALAELARVVRPGGLVIVTMDNPWNPLYGPLRWASRRGLLPFPLGYTPSVRRLEQDLRDVGLVPEGRDWLLHNPRGLSTALFLALRRVLGRRADAPVGALLAAFALLGRAPTRPMTACFHAVTARRAASSGQPGRR
jgi:SAM-dependent methyltransferase